MVLQATIRESGDITILDVQGRVTIGEDNDWLARELRRLFDAGTRKLLVNLGGVTKIDSSGISTVVRSFVELGHSGGSLKLLVPAGRVRQVLSTARLLAAIPTFEDEATALASFR